jgi:hypothetical protein
MELGRKFPCFPCFIIFHHFSSFFPIKLGMFQCQVRWQRGNFVSFPWTLLWQSLSSQVYIPLPPQHRQQTGDKFCNVCQYVRKCTSLERFISHLTPAGPAKPGWPPKLAPQIWRNEKNSQTWSSNVKHADINCCNPPNKQAGLENKAGKSRQQEWEGVAIIWGNYYPITW